MNNIFQIKKIKDYLSISFKVIIFSLIVIASTSAQEKIDNYKDNEYGIAFLKKMLINVDANDAFVAIKVWIDELNKHLNTGIVLKPSIYEDMDDLAKNIKKDKLSIIICNSIDYLQYKSKLPITPIFTSSIESGETDQFVLLVKNSDNIKEISALKEKKLIIHTGANLDFTELWLGDLLYENNCAAKNAFFKEVKEGTLASQVLLSVFFGQYDACIVTKSSFETMKELNPQVGKSLQILDTSPPFISGLACFTDEFLKMNISDKIQKSAYEIEDYPSGKQIFTLLRIKKLLFFKEKYLNSTKELLIKSNTNEKKHNVTFKRIHIS